MTDRVFLQLRRAVSASPKVLCLTDGVVTGYYVAVENYSTVPVDGVNR